MSKKTLPEQKEYCLTLSCPPTLTGWFSQNLHSQVGFFQCALSSTRETAGRLLHDKKISHI